MIRKQSKVMVNLYRLNYPTMPSYRWMAHSAMTIQKVGAMGDLLGALATGFAIFGLSILTGIILYFLLKDSLKGIFHKKE
jgi:hypothetical protein